MKKIICSLFFSLITLVLNAQQENETLLLSIFQNAENDFANIIGPKISDSKEEYDSKVKLGIGNEYIEKTKNGKGAIYVLTSEYFKIEDFEKTVESFINANFSASKFNIKSEKSEFTEDSYVEVFEKNGKIPLFAVAVEITPKLATNYVIKIYGKAARME